MTISINKLFKLTGKKIILMAHSFGAMKTLKYLDSYDINLKEKHIKSYISVGGPILGVEWCNKSLYMLDSTALYLF